MLSIIIPSYNEEKMICKTSEIISEILENEKIAYEIIFIDDGSKDNTWREIENEHNKNSKIRGISFSRNFGKEAAIHSGLTECRGECAIVIDCDLQHPPKKIIEMYKLWLEGYEIVEGIKKNRGEESIVHRIGAKFFYKILSNATGIDMSNSSDYKLVDRKVINTLINMREKDAFFRALSSWVGYKSTKIYYEIQEREEGASKWSMASLSLYAITNITSFSSLPLQIVTFLGILMLLMGMVLTIMTLMQWYNNSAVEGFTTVIILQCFSGSIIMISLGIIGYYISKIYAGIQNRPKYIISERIN